MMDKEIREMIDEVGNKPMPRIVKSNSWLYTDEDGNKRVDIPKLGDTIIKKADFSYISDKSQEFLYRYTGDQEGYWEQVPPSHLARLVSKELQTPQGNYWRPRLEKDTVQYINSHVDAVPVTKSIHNIPAYKFNFKNGVWDWEQMKLLPHDKNLYFTGVAGIDLDTEPKETPETEKYFKLIFGENAKTMMEFIGYIFYPNYDKIQAYVMLLGSGDDGKSTFVEKWLKPIVGKSFCSAIPLKDLTRKDGKFKRVELFGKFLNAHSENSETPINDTATLKELTGGDSTNSDVKGKSDITFINMAKMLFATNNLPPFRDNSKGMRRRPFIVQFHKIENYEDVIDWEKLKAERSAFIYQCILLASQAMKRGQLTETESIKQLRTEWLGTNSPIAMFLDECTYESKGNEVDRQELYNVYANWCNINGFTPLNSQKLFAELKNNFDLLHKRKQKRINGNRKDLGYFYHDIALTVSQAHFKDKTV